MLPSPLVGEGGRRSRSDEGAVSASYMSDDEGEACSPLIRLAARATFSSKGRRAMNAALRAALSPFRHPCGGLKLTVNGEACATTAANPLSLAGFSAAGYSYSRPALAGNRYRQGPIILRGGSRSNCRVRSLKPRYLKIPFVTVIYFVPPLSRCTVVNA